MMKLIHGPKMLNPTNEFIEFNEMSSMSSLKQLKENFSEEKKETDSYEKFVLFHRKLIKKKNLHTQTHPV